MQRSGSKASSIRCIVPSSTQRARAKIRSCIPAFRSLTHEGSRIFDPKLRQHALPSELKSHASLNLLQLKMVKSIRSPLHFRKKCFARLTRLQKTAQRAPTADHLMSSTLHLKGWPSCAFPSTSASWHSWSFGVLPMRLGPNRIAWIPPVHIKLKHDTSYQHLLTVSDSQLSISR